MSAANLDAVRASALAGDERAIKAAFLYQRWKDIPAGPAHVVQRRHLRRAWQRAVERFAESQ